MSIRTIQASEGLDAVWDELVYTEAVVSAEPLARPLAALIAALIARTELAQAAQKAAWRAELVAQALVDHADVNLDDKVTVFALDLARAEAGDKRSPRFKLYFPHTVSEVVRLGLESEIKRIDSWPQTLAGETDATLTTYGPAFTSLITDGKAALQARQDSAIARATQRVREILTLVDDVNNTRLSLAGQLTQIGVAHHLAKDWADRFFRHLHKTPRSADPTPAVTPAPTR